MGAKSNNAALQNSITTGLSGSPADSGMSTLYQFLSLDDDALEQLEATIRRIRRMTPEERAAFQKKILEYHQMPSEERQHIQQAWGKLDSAVRSAWRDYMMRLDSDERDQIRQQMQATPAESRTSWRIAVLKEAGLLTEEQIEDLQ